MTERLYIAPDGVRFGGGKFDDTKKYFRAGASGSDFPMPSGITIEVRTDTADSNRYKAMFKFDVDRATHEHRANQTGYGSLSASSFTADLTTVTTV